MMIRDDLLFVFGERHFSFVVFLSCCFVFLSWCYVFSRGVFCLSWDRSLFCCVTCMDRKSIAKLCCLARKSFLYFWQEVVIVYIRL
jgi:hypothetical protein